MQHGQLPPGWDQFFDENTGRLYYFDQVNNRTHWERPTQPARPDGARDAASDVDTKLAHGPRPGEAPPPEGGKSTTLKDIIKDLSAAGRIDEAERLIQQVLADVQEQYGANAPASAEFLNLLVVLYHKAGKNQLAADAAEKAWLVLRACYGEDDRFVATALNNYALALSPLGDFRKAEYLFKRAVDVRIKLFGDGHPEVAQTLHNLALLHRSSQRWDEAATNFSTSRSIWRGHDMWGLVALSYREEAQMMRQMGDNQEAYRLYNAELEILRKTLPPTHKAVLESERNVMSLQQHARPLAQQIASPESRVHPPSHHYQASPHYPPAQPALSFRDQYSDDSGAYGSGVNGQVRRAPLRYQYDQSPGGGVFGGHGAVPSDSQSFQPHPVRRYDPPPTQYSPQQSAPYQPTPQYQVSPSAPPREQLATSPTWKAGWGDDGSIHV